MTSLAPPTAQLTTLTVARAVPELSLVSMTPGSSTDILANSNGLLLHFWATWCPPCLRELPLLLAGCRAAGFSHAAVSLDKTSDVVERYIDRMGVPASNIFMQEGILETDGLLMGGILPATLVVDRSGSVRARGIGEIEWRSPERWSLVAKWVR